MTLRAGFGMFYDVGYGVVGQAFFGAPYADVRTASEIGFPLAPGDLAAPVLPPVAPLWTNPDRRLRACCPL